VDLFFSLSGFLITKLLVAEYEQTGKINIRNFYIRRALRILPLYFLFISFTAITTLYFQGWNTASMVRIAGLATFSDNFISAISGLNFISYSIHLWTISYEMQFYLIAPAALIWLLKKDKTTRLAVLALLFAAGTLIRGLFIQQQASSTAIYVLPFIRFEAMLGGIAFGLGIFDKPLSKPGAWLPLLIGFACLTLVFTLPNFKVVGWNLMITYPLVGIGASLLLHAILWDPNARFTVFLGSPFLVVLGRISYGLYTYHIMALVVTTNLFFRLGMSQTQVVGLYPVVFLLALLLTIGISTISYLSVEKYFLKRKANFISVCPGSL
jgi:peptidoglycan/LPS O-acetylase OafA/YrhL